MMNSKCFSWLLLSLSVLTSTAWSAPFMRPPAFLGGIPGKSQFQAIQLQRHQARTLLYREALEELRANPKAADVPDCPVIQTGTRTLCIRASGLTQSTPISAPPTATTPTGGNTSSAGNGASHRIAILIGNNSYSDPIPSLNTPIADVEKIAEVLQLRYGYETRVLHNAGKAKIVETFNQVAEEAGPNDSVLLFYAGHGYLMDDTKMGFWIPVDASVRTAANWISNSDISKLLKAIPSRQVLLISDSCFSGSLTREQKLSAGISAKDADILSRRSVLAFSSGGEEPVSDDGMEGHSIFAWHFIHTMEKTNRGTALGFDIYRTVHDGVTSGYPQEPQYGAVYSAGHADGGEYLFQTK